LLFIITQAEGMTKQKLDDKLFIHGTSRDKNRFSAGE